jgi:hypothetical protein
VVGARVCCVWPVDELLTAAAEVVTRGAVVVVAEVAVAVAELVVTRVGLAGVKLVVAEVSGMLSEIVADDELTVVVTGLLLVVTVSVMVLPAAVAEPKTSADLPHAGDANTSKRPVPRVSIETGRVTFRMDGRVGVPGLLAMMRPPGWVASLPPEQGHRSPSASPREGIPARRTKDDRTTARECGMVSDWDPDELTP